MKEKLIIDSTLTNQIKKKIDSIALKITNSPDSPPYLMGGKTGELLFLAYYSQYSENFLLQNKINKILLEIFNKVEKGFRFPTFASGLAGIGWSIEHLTQNNFINANTNLIIGNLDDYLFPYMQLYNKQKNYDYLHGAIGIGLFYLSRPLTPKIQQYLEGLVEDLEKQSIQEEGNIVWETSLGQDKMLKGYNLSLSHGLASIIVFLSRLYEVGINKEKTNKLTNSAINFLLHCKNNSPLNKYMFPAWICKDKPENLSGGRLAWCYNDLGIGIALWQAGTIFNNNDWKQEAIKILLHTTNFTKQEETKVVDAGLCHGTSGIAHIYSKIYAQTSIKEFRDSAIFWIKKTLEMASHKDGLAGYKAYHPLEYGGWHNDYSFLEGIAGIGLSMISVISDIEPKWDRAILLS